jgi:hypothetical protein
MKRIILSLFSIAMILFIGCKNGDENNVVPQEKSVSKLNKARISGGIEYLMLGPWEECIYPNEEKTITVRVSSGDFQPHSNVQIGILIGDELELLSSSSGFFYTGSPIKYGWNLGYLPPFSPVMLTYTIRKKVSTSTGETSVGVFLYGVDEYMSYSDNNLKQLIRHP